MSEATTGRLGRLVLAALVLVAALTGRPAAAQDAGARAEAELAEARRLFDALDYENAVPAFDRAIAALEPLAAQQVPMRPALATAYELRGRARFGLGDREGAVADFTALLGVNPSFAFASQVSPRVVALLEEVKAATVGTLQLTVDPADAALEVDGQAFTPAVGAGVAVKAGELTVKATRIGYRPVEQRVSVAAGETKPLALTMERTAAAVFLVTSPPDVEVIVDGTSKGRTVAAPGSAPASPGAASQAGARSDAVSQPLALSDLPPGAHTIQFRKPCHVSIERTLTIDTLADYTVEPVRLEPAVGTLTIQSAPAGASVFLDGEPRGTAPVTLGEVCEGTRLVELRGPQGRFVKRLAVRPGDRVQVQGMLKPGFALLPAGAGVANSGVSDPRPSIEKVLAASQRVTVFVPEGPALEEAGKSELPPPEWLAFDAGRRPVSGAASISAAARRELSARYARELGVQGVAAVTQPSPASPELVISLLAAGAGVPDVVPILPERVDSVNKAIARFDFVPPLVMNTIGLMAVEVADGEGAIVATVEAGSAAAQAGLAAGDIITKADGQPAKAPGVFQRALDARKPGETMALEVMDRTGARRTVEVSVQQRARLISEADQTLLFNPLSVALRTRLAAANPVEQPVVRLNLGVALLRLGDYAGAREQFEAVQLSEGPGVSRGTQQYLLGLALEGMGDVAAAQAAWQAAAKSDAWLTEDGPLVRPLAERRLR